MSRTIKLKPYEEIVGALEHIDREGNEITIIINGLKLVFPAGSVEAESVGIILPDEWVGHRIGLLRTDNLCKPLCARIIK